MRRTLVSRFSVLLTAAVAAFSTPPAPAASDGIFPASTDAARKAVDWANGYFVINGQPTFLTSGEIHYARVPRELWRDRILRAKALGFNTIQTYVMWNAQEPREGHFNFQDNLDLDAWLSLCKELGMYAVVRPGPYVCAEWENGGLPAWLCSKPGMRVRTNDPHYLRHVDRFFGKVLPIIAKHQIHKGGSVIMVQLENELPNTWGTDSNAYTKHLYDFARAQGLEVPLFNSGLHHSDDPAGNRPFGPRTVPWYVTEFWTGWIGLSGDMSPQKFEEKVRGTWKILGFGGAGYTYYVVHGGTNFGYSKGAEVTASYDYAAPIGEAGQLRKVYFPMKRAAMFAQAFSDILTRSREAPNFGTATKEEISVTARSSINGDIIFLSDTPRFQNPGRGARGRRGGPATAPAQSQNLQPWDTTSRNLAWTTAIKRHDGVQFPENHLDVKFGEIRPILVNVPVHGDAELRNSQPAVFDYVGAHVLTRVRIGQRTYWVVYGTPGRRGEVRLKNAEQPLPFTFPEDDTVQEVAVPNATASLLIMNTDLADRTWIQNDSLVIGPDYVSPDAMHFPTKNRKAVIYSASGKREITSPLHDVIAPLPALANWQTRPAAEPLPTTDVSRWTASREPRSMEMHNDYANGWGWYRTTISGGPAGGQVQMRFTGAGDVLRLYLNGQRIEGDRNGATLRLQPGDNTLAVLCWNEGRPKMYNFVGPTGLLSARGIWGPVLLIGDQPLATLNTWKAREATADDNAPALPGTDDSSWTASRGGANRVGYHWLRASFDLPDTALQAGNSAMLLHGGVDDEGEFFLNGTSLGRHVGYNVPGAIDLAPALKPGKNVLAIRVKNNDGAGGLPRPIDIVSLKGKQENWKFSPGVGGLEETALIGTVTNWPQWLAAGASAVPAATRNNLPTFYRTDFAWRPDPQLHETIAFSTRGLRAGSVWLNGHNLGPYRNAPNGQPAQMYIPECWLKEQNTLVIFDAEGATPNQVTLDRIETFVRVPTQAAR